MLSCLKARSYRMLNVIASIVYIGAASLVAGCLNDALMKANQQQLAEQQAELDQLKQEVAALQTPPPAHNYPSPPPGSCDLNIMREATRNGGQRFAAGDFSGALGYYQDALTACPKSAQANLNLARAYEAIGDRAQALSHYRAAANAGGSDADANAVSDARAALTRLGG
jgi:tetratricopeptide (TPR) repeat protein